MSKFMFDNFEESLLENLVYIQPEPQLVYQIPQTRENNGNRLEGELYFILESRHIQTLDKEGEILQIRLTPLAWFEKASKKKQPCQIWYNKDRTQGWFDTFQLCVNHNEKVVRFGPSGNLLITEKDLRGIGIGTYAWRILINWAKRKFPDYKVYQIEISPVDATEDNLKRRNHFFIKHGFKPFYEDQEGREGWFRCEKVNALKPSIFIPAWEHKNPIKMIADLLQEKEELECKIRVIKQNTTDWFSHFDRILARQKQLKALLVFLSFCLVFLLGFILFTHL